MGQLPGGVQNALSQMGIAGGVNAPGGRPTERNAIMTQVLPIAVGVGGIVVATILTIVTGVSSIMYLGQLCQLACMALIIIAMLRMGNELKAVTNNPQFTPWHVIIPIYGPLVVVPQEMARAKQMRGVQAPVRNIVIYFFFQLYAFASDLNDIAKAP